MQLDRKQSFMGCKLFNPKNSTIDWKLLLGSLCFGLGWGIGGLCPGPAIVLFSVFTLQIGLVWFGCLIIGQHLAALLDKKTSKPKSEPVSSYDRQMKVEQDTTNDKQLLQDKVI